ncbi:MAG: aspartate/glutamate racemase family protein [Anaerolineae bacterium]
MKKLGIIGGAGPLASALFYETLVRESYQLKQPLPEIVLLNYPFTRGLTPTESQENGSQLHRELLHCLTTLETGGATVAVLVCNTLHLKLPRIPPRSFSLLRIPELLFEEIDKKKGKRLLLLGTQNTCNSSLYHQPGVTIFHPICREQKIVDEAIDHILEGALLEKDAEAIEDMIRSFPEEIDGVILGCTDLPVLHHHFPFRSDKPIYDSVKIPAKKILRFL